MLCTPTPPQKIWRRRVYFCHPESWPPENEHPALIFPCCLLELSDHDCDICCETDMQLTCWCVVDLSFLVWDSLVVGIGTNPWVWACSLEPRITPWSCVCERFYFLCRLLVEGTPTNPGPGPRDPFPVLLVLVLPTASCYSVRIKVFSCADRNKKKTTKDSFNVCVDLLNAENTCVTLTRTL